MIARLKVDSSDYENKLKRATQTLQKMASDCQKVGGTMAIAEKEDIAFAKALGSMDAVAKSAKGKLAELNNTFTEASVIYKRLTDEEKSSPFGNALSSSIDQLRGRITSAKTELDDVTRSLGNTKTESNSTGNILEQLAGKFGLNVSQLKTFGGALAVAGAALKVAEDAFMANESCVDEWGRTVKSGEGLYQSFVSSLNNASFSSFLSNIQEVINSARDAYNALDNLATKGGIISNKEAKLNYQKEQQMRIVNDKSRSEAERKAAQQRLKSIDKEMTSAKKATAELNNEVVKSKLNDMLTGVGFKKGSKEFKAAYAEAVKSLYDENYVMKTVNVGYQSGMKISNGKTTRYTDNGDRNLNNILTDKLRAEINPYVQAVWSSLSQAESQSRMANRFAQKDVTTGGKGGKGKTSDFVYDSGTIGDLQKQVAEKTKLLNNTFDETTYNQLFEDIKQLQARIQAIKDIPLFTRWRELSGTVTEGVGTSSFQQYNDSKLQQNIMSHSQISGADQRKMIKGLSKVDGNTGNLTGTVNELGKAWQSVATTINSATTAISAFGDESEEAQSVNAVLGIAGAVATLIAQFAATDKGSTWYEWVAAAASGAATLVGVISSLNSAYRGSFAEGGIVPGAYNGGRDNSYIYASPGEVILNRAQQQNIASQLQSNSGIGNMRLSATISGEDIRLALNNNSRRRGKGEYVTSR